MPEITNVLSDFPNAIKAQRKGNNTLILRECKPIKRLDRKMACYEIEYRWHLPEADVHSVQGQEFSYWTKKEIKTDKCLFEQVNLF